MFFSSSQESEVKNDILSFSSDMTKYLDSGLSFLESIGTYLLDCHDFGSAYIAFKEAVEETPESSYAQNAYSSLTEMRNKIISSPIYDKKYVITGSLIGMERETALGLINLFGGKTSDNPVNDMDVLVVGHSEWIDLNNGQPTRKILKAQELKQKGRDIQIINDAEFIHRMSVIAKDILSEDSYLFYFSNNE